MGHMEMVAEQELQGVGPGGEIQLHLGLTATKMAMPVVSRNRLARGRHCIDIDQQMVMACRIPLDTCRGNAHVLQTKYHGNGT